MEFMKMMKDFKTAICGETGQQALQIMKCKFHWATMTNKDRQAYREITATLKEERGQDNPPSMQIRVTVPPSISKESADRALRQIQLEHGDCPVKADWPVHHTPPSSKP